MNCPTRIRTRLAAAVGLDNATPQPIADKKSDATAKATSVAAASASSNKLERVDYVRAWLSKSKDNVLERLQEKFRVKAFVFDRPDGVRAIDAVQAAGDDLDPAKTAEQLTTTGQVTAIGEAFSDLGLRHAMGHLAGVVVVSDFDQLRPTAAG